MPRPKLLCQGPDSDYLTCNMVYPKSGKYRRKHAAKRLRPPRFKTTRIYRGRSNRRPVRTGTTPVASRTL